MVILQTEVESEAIGLSEEAFEMFCNDISGMFGIEVSCDVKKQSTATVKDLKKSYKGLAAIYSVKAEGAVNGTFHLIFDQDGLFTLGGTIVMLSKNRILKNKKRGAQEDAENFRDAISEAGNLLVGVWDRVFRDKLKGHGHFIQSRTFIGKPWMKSEEAIRLGKDEEVIHVPCEMTIGFYPAFKCGAIFSKSVFNDLPEAVLGTYGETGEDEETEEVVLSSYGTYGEAAEEARRAVAPSRQVKEEVKVEAKEETRVEAEEEVKEEVKEEAKEEAVPTPWNSAGKRPLRTLRRTPPSGIPKRTYGEEEVKEEVKEEAKEEVKEEFKEEEVLRILYGEEEVGEVKADDSPPPLLLSQESGGAAVLPSEGIHASLAVCAKDIMDTDVVWVSSNDSVKDSLTKMRQKNTGYLLVGSDASLEGVVSKSDMAGAVSPYLKPVFAKWRRPLDDATLRIKMKWIMSRPVRTVKLDTSVAVIMENMRAFGGRCLPVVDDVEGDAGKVLGIVTVFDIFKFLFSNHSTCRDSATARPAISTEGKVTQSPPLV